MHIVNICGNERLRNEKNKQGQKCKLSLKQIIVSFCMAFPWYSDNFFKKHCLLTSLVMCCYSHLHGKQFASILQNYLLPHAHLHFRICHPIML